MNVGQAGYVVAGRWWARIASAVAGGCMLAALGSLSGCSQSSTATTQPSSMTDRQDRLLQDPFSYTPDPNSSDMTVSGNGTFDGKALQRDVDHVLHP